MTKTLHYNSMASAHIINDSSICTDEHDVIHFLEHKDTPFSAEKQRALLETSLIIRMNRILAETPNTSFLTFHIKTLTGLDEKISPEIISEITDFITKGWIELTASKNAKNVFKMYPKVEDITYTFNEDRKSAY